MNIKTKLLVPLILLLAGCGQTEQQPAKRACSVLSEIESFDVMALLSPYENLDGEKVMATIVRSLEKVGKVSVLPKGPLVDSLLAQPPTGTMSALISIGKVQDRLEASVKMGTEVEVVANDCPSFCTVWSKSVSSSTDEKEVTALASRLVEELLATFEKEYAEANAGAAKKPLFKVRDLERAL